MDSHGVVIIGGAPVEGYRRSSVWTHGRSEGVECKMWIGVWELDAKTTSLELSPTAGKPHSYRGWNFSLQAAAVVLDDVLWHYPVGIVDHKLILS